MSYWGGWGGGEWKEKVKKKYPQGFGSKIEVL